MFLWFYYPYSKMTITLGFTITAVCAVHCLFHHLSSFAATGLELTLLSWTDNISELDLCPMFSVMFLQVEKGFLCYSDNGQTQWRAGQEWVNTGKEKAERERQKGTRRRKRVLTEHVEGESEARQAETLKEAQGAEHGDVYREGDTQTKHQHEKHRENQHRVPTKP